MSNFFFNVEKERLSVHINLIFILNLPIKIMSLNKSGAQRRKETYTGANLEEGEV